MTQDPLNDDVLAALRARAYDKSLERFVDPRVIAAYRHLGAPAAWRELVLGEKVPSTAITYEQMVRLVLAAEADPAFKARPEPVIEPSVAEAAAPAYTPTRKSRRDRERTTCPDCGREVTVTRFGRLMAHQDTSGRTCVRAASAERHATTMREARR